MVESQLSDGIRLWSRGGGLWTLPDVPAEFWVIGASNLPIRGLDARATVPRPKVLLNIGFAVG